MTEASEAAALVYDSADEYRPEPEPKPQPPAWCDGGIRIGIHTSIAGNISGALESAHGLGANALQIFSASPRMWTRGLARVAESDASRFRARRKELGLGPLVIHDNYLINLASANPVLRARSVQAFHQELVRAIALGADFLVAHPGCCGGDRGLPEAGHAIAHGLNEATRGLKVRDLGLLLENTAGQGTSVGSRFEELQGIIDKCPELPLGVCIDTAHLFAAGWDLRTAEGLAAALQDIERVIGLKHVAVIHTNDSKVPHGSRVDRHEHIGKGKIGLEAFRRILNHGLLAGRAFILETPIDKLGDDRRNVAALWKLLGVSIPVTGGRDGMKPRRKKKSKKHARKNVSRAKAGTKKRTARKKSRGK